MARISLIILVIVTLVVGFVPVSSLLQGEDDRGGIPSEQPLSDSETEKEESQKEFSDSEILLFCLSTIIQLDELPSAQAIVPLQRLVVEQISPSAPDHSRAPPA